MREREAFIRLLMPAVAGSLLYAVVLIGLAAMLLMLVRHIL